MSTETEKLDTGVRGPRRARSVKARGGTFIERVESLSPRQRTVLERIRLGKSSREIADELGISIKTVETHRTHINGIFGTSSVVELLLLCFANGLYGSGGAFGKRANGPDGHVSVEVKTTLFAPPDWDEDQISGWVACQLHFPKHEEQVHPQGPLLPHIGVLQTSITRRPQDKQPVFIEFTGRIDVDKRDDDGPVTAGENVGDVALCSASAAGLPEDGLAVGGTYPLKHLLEAFAGKRVVISVRELPESV